MMRLIRVVPITVLSLVSGGCVFGPKKVAVSLPMPPQPSLTKPAPVLQLPASVTPIETPIEEAPAPVAKTEEPMPEPVVPPPAEEKKPAPRRPRQTVATAPPAPTPEAAPPEGPVPTLREILTPERQVQYENEFSRSMASARGALGRVQGRNLTVPQRENVSRIQTFLTQADAARRDDLGTALQLARRADLLGQDLLKSLLP
jgi:hypothetical protein